jgi:SAM-dependent methyltransferase
MLSIEEIKLLIEKLELVKKEDLQKLIDSNLKILRNIETVVDANNQETINRYDKTPEWFVQDVQKKRDKPEVDEYLYRMVQTKIYQFARNSAEFNSLEIGPGFGTFSKEFRSWRLNFFLDIIPEFERTVRRRFNPGHQKYIKWYNTDENNWGMSNSNIIPSASCNFIFSWDTFVFFTQTHIEEYLRIIKRILIPGGYVFLHYADCHYDHDLKRAKKGYWNYNNKNAMTKIIKSAGYELVEMNQFRPGANYTIFRRPGKQNPVVYKVSEITLD